MRRSSAIGIAIVVMLLGVFIPPHVAADCQGGPVWPSLDRARGTTFVGVFEGATAYNAEGDETFHWTVEHVYAGPLNPGPLDDWGIGEPSCHPTKYREGTRYLVSSRFPGGGDAFDTVAYELLDGGRVRIAQFPMQPRSTAPKVYRRVDTLRQALRLLVPSGPRTTLPPSRRPPFEPTSEDHAKDDLFVLSIATDSTEVVANEPIEITTTLRYVGGVKNQKATVSGGGNLVAFGVEQLDGPIDTGPGWRLSCGFHEFGPDETLDIPFAKSGGFAADDPLADFWRSWFADPVLRLPEGRYVITAYAHHGGRGPVCHQGPWKTLTASVAIEVLPRPISSPDPIAEPSGALVPAISPSPGPSATPIPSTVELSSPVDLAALPWPYTCDSPAFRASVLTTPGGIPTDDPGLRRMVQARGPDAHLLWADEDDAVVGVIVDDSARARFPVYYHDLEKVDGLWRPSGGEGDCQPWARFEQLRALGGRWRLDPAYPPPNRRSTVLHVLVTYPGCPTAVEPRGRPRVATTGDAVVVVVPVVTTNTSDMCTPGRPSAVTILLSEPLGDRTLYDAGTLPMREVRVSR